MDNKILYPKTIEDLMDNVSFLIEHEQNFELIENLTLWVKWFEGLNYNLNNELEIINSEHRLRIDESPYMKRSSSKRGVEVLPINTSPDST